MLVATMRLWRRNLSEKETARRAELWGLLALPVGIVAIIVSVALAVWTVRRSEELAVASGALDKAKPILYLAGMRVDKTLRVYVAAPFPSKGLTVIELPLEIRNEGDKTYKGAEVIVREPSMVAIDNKFLQSETQSVIPISQAPERHFAKMGRYAYSSFAFPDMHPGQTMGIGEPIIGTDSHIQVEGQATTKDGVPVSYSVAVDISMPIAVSVTGEDLHATEYQIDVVGLKAANEDEANTALLAAIRAEEDSLAEKQSWWQRAVNFVAPLHRRALLISPVFDKQDQPDGGSVYLEKGEPATKVVNYTVR